MKQCCLGEGLISAIIYIAAATVMVALLLQNSSVLYPKLAACGRHTNLHLKTCMALDMMIRDLYSAPYDRAAWNIINKNEIGWNCHKKNIKWRYSKNRLVRVEHIFDPQEKCWRSNSVQSIATDSISECNFIANEAGSFVKSVTISLTFAYDGYKMRRKRTVALRTGVCRCEANN